MSAARGPRKRGSRAGAAARAQVESGKPNHRLESKICAFWQEGRCLRGAGCKYAHGDSERHQEPDLTKTALCRKMLSGEGCNDPKCTFAHSRDELRSTDDVYKTSMCTFFRYGRCQMGRNCRHAHFESELRQRKDRDDQSDLEDDSDGDLINEHAPTWGRSITMPPAVGQELPLKPFGAESKAGQKDQPDHPNWADMTEEEDDDDFFDETRLRTICLDAGNARQHVVSYVHDARASVLFPGRGGLAKPPRGAHPEAGLYLRSSV
eukprot:s6357_g1.t1